MAPNLLWRLILSSTLLMPFLIFGQGAPKTRLFEKGFVSTSFIDGSTHFIQAPASAFFDNKWHKGQIELQNGELKTGVHIRYDLINSTVTTKIENEIVAYPTRLVKSFSWYNFVIADSVQFVSIDNPEDPASDNIYEVILKGTPNIILAKTKVSIQDANYLPALDLGSPEKKVIRRTEFWLYDGDKIYPIHKKLEKNLLVFRPFEKEVYHFARAYKLKSKRKEDLIVMIRYLNRLRLQEAEEIPENFSAFNPIPSNAIQ
ncbi:MAG: hypothetical protein KI791_12425 [Cyclobacteriaceae bacterium]|nr:hypothetical protein [Cyclobacteriaceae bacterium SS2]